MLDQHYHVPTSWAGMKMRRVISLEETPGPMQIKNCWQAFLGKEVTLIFNTLDIWALEHKFWSREELGIPK